MLQTVLYNLDQILTLNDKATLPSSDVALPPPGEAASKDVPLTVNTLTASSHFTVLRALPKSK